MIIDTTSRTEHSARNMTYAVIGRVAALLMGFGSRVVLTHTMSVAYTGVNGLFVDIINILSLSELGFGTAISYILYKPIAEGDIEKQKSYMKLCRTFYVVVAFIVAVVGLMLVPFLDVIIKDKPDVPHLTVIYLLFLLNSVCSYILIYKKTLLDAYQLNHISISRQMLAQTIQTCIQMFILLFTRNFLLYTFMIVLGTLAGNILISREADKRFEFLKDKSIVALDKSEKRGIYKNVRAMLLHKTGNVLVNNTDNLLLSAIVGISATGLYSNYFLVIESVRVLFSDMFKSMAGSIGNLGVTADKKRVERIYNAVFLMDDWIFAMAAICLFEVLTPFVSLSFGKVFVFDSTITMVLCINFYIAGMREATLAFRDTLGLFRHDRYKSIAATVINLVASIVLGRMFGTLGIFLGTLVSTLATAFWVEPLVLYRVYFKKSTFTYFVRYFIYAITTAGLWLLSHLACSKLPNEGVGAIAVRFLVSFIIVNAGLFLCFFKTQEFKLLTHKAIELVLSKAKTEKTGEETRKSYINLCKVLSPAVFGKEADDTSFDKVTVDLATANGLVSLLEPVADRFDETEKQSIFKEAVFTAKRNYRFFMLTKYTLAGLKKAGIEAVSLKGAALSGLYPKPDLRAYSDVDIKVFDKTDIDKLDNALIKLGFKKCEKQDSNHHIAYLFEDKYKLEVHVKSAREFDNERGNRVIEEILSPAPDRMCERKVYDCVLPVFDAAREGFYLTVHMLQHYLNSGFGLKLLMDFSVFFNRDLGNEVLDKYREYTNSAGISGFSDVVCATAVRLFGIDKENLPFSKEADADMLINSAAVTALIDEMISAGRLGEGNSSRLVNLREQSAGGLLREFHHQMKNNHKKASKCILLWPVLWVITLVVFVRNNKKVRNTSTLSVISNAYQRSKLSEEMRLWKTK